jgi:hypothetical protein
MHLSAHFRKNWRNRIGNEPNEELVAEIMRHGRIVQKPMRLMTEDGKPHKQLGIYWDPELNVVITVDEYNDVAVSVLTGNGKNR